MDSAVINKYMGSFACPACQSLRLLLTKEAIIICQDCLNGYKVIDDVPDFRLENAISFKQRLSAYKKGLKALLSCVTENNSQETREIKPGHCVVIGRRINKDFTDEGTVIQNISENTYTKINRDSQNLVEKCFSKPVKTNTNTAIHQADRMTVQQQDKQLLGNFIRDFDFLIDEPSVSRAHAVVYQDEEGVHLIDLVSKNGTYVNGREVEKRRLKNNDVINLGKAAMCIHIS
ncbi:MAG: FHA domain-containing protein [Deltaproteobacteria bacterium]|nr:FHA domain-containing protein [Deltaproteobacteria bacterium]